jgi:hypothetical protein
MASGLYYKNALAFAHQNGNSGQTVCILEIIMQALMGNAIFDYA